MKEQKRKIVRSVSAFAFALSLFAAGSGTQVSASEIDPSIAGASIASSYDEETDSDVDDGQVAEGTNDDNAEDITTTYSQEKQAEDNSEAESEKDTSPTIEDEQENVEPVAFEPAEAPVSDVQDSPSPAETAVDESAPVQEASPNTEEVADDTQDTEAAAATVGNLLNAADGYNVFIEGDYTQYAAGGNVDMGDGSAIVAVGGNMNFENTVAGSIEVGGSINGSTNSPAVSGEDCTIDFQSAFNSLRETSSSLTSYDGIHVSSNDPNNYIKNEYGTVTFKGDNENLNVFTLTVEEYNALVGSESHSLNYDVPDGSTVLINIVGEGDLNLVAGWGASFAGNQLTSGNSKNSQVLVNVPNASNVKIGCSVGALLAPNSHITSNGDVQHYEGQVIGKSFEGSIEFGSTSFNGNITPDEPNEPNTPEVPDTPDEPDEPNTPEVPDTPDEPDEPNTPEVPDTPDEPDEPNTPEVPDTPDEPDEPNIPEVPDTPDEPDEPNTPEVPDTPDEPDEPNTPEVPDTPDEPDEPDTPEVPDTPDGPDEPNIPEVPDTPDEPDEPNIPEVPDTPDEPDEPNIPEVPDTPDKPNEPDTPKVPDKPDEPIPSPVIPHYPTTPDKPYEPDVPNDPFDDPIVPITDFDLVDEPKAPEDADEVKMLNEESPADFETFEDSPVPLSDSPFSEESDTEIDTVKNPKTGNENKMVAPAMTALAAMTILLEELNRKKRTE